MVGFKMQWSFSPRKLNWNSLILNATWINYLTSTKNNNYIEDYHICIGHNVVLYHPRLLCCVQAKISLGWRHCCCKAKLKFENNTAFLHVGDEKADKLRCHIIKTRVNNLNRSPTIHAKFHAVWKLPKFEKFSRGSHVIQTNFRIVWIWRAQL